MMLFRLLLALAAISPVFGRIVKINMLGDSITGVPGCWRALLWQQLQTAGINNTDFVGSLPATKCAFAYDGENDGHGGFTATGIVANNQLPGWLAASRPDVVMMQLGTNDVFTGVPTTSIIPALSTLVDQMRASNPKMYIVVSQITPMNLEKCPTCPAGIISLNAAIASWAPNKSTPTSPVLVIDCYSGYNTGTDTYDGVHPTDSGNVKLAACHYSALANAIREVQDTPARSNSSAPSSTSSTPAPQSSPAAQSKPATEPNVIQNVSNTVTNLLKNLKGGFRLWW